MKKNLYSLMSLALILAASITSTSCRDDDSIVDNGEGGSSTETTEQTVAMSDIVGQWVNMYTESPSAVDFNFAEVYDLQSDGKYTFSSLDYDNKYYLYDEGTWAIADGNYFDSNSYGMANDNASHHYHIKSATKNIITFDNVISDNNWYKTEWVRWKEEVNRSVSSSWVAGIWHTDSAKAYVNHQFSENITDMLAYAEYDEDGKCYSIFHRNGEYVGYDGTWQMNGTKVIHDEDYTTTILYVNKKKGLLTMAVDKDNERDVYYFSQSSKLPDWTPAEETHYYTTDEVSGIWYITNEDGDVACIEFDSDGTGSNEGCTNDGEYVYDEFTWTIEDNVITTSNGEKYTVESADDDEMTVIDEDGDKYTLEKQSKKPTIPVNKKNIYGSWQLSNTKNYADGKLVSTTYETEWRVYDTSQFINIYNQRTDDGSYVGLSTTWNLNSDWTISYGSTAFSTQRVVKVSESNLVLRKSTGENSYQLTEYTRVSSVPDYTVSD